MCERWLCVCVGVVVVVCMCVWRGKEGLGGWGGGEGGSARGGFRAKFV